jgi:hypothetical protein
MSCRAAVSLSSLSSCFIMPSMLRETGGRLRPESFRRTADKSRERLKRYCLLCFLVTFLSLGELAHSQVSPGYPPLSAYDTHSTDTINLENLNILLNAPVRSKAGAFPFTLDLQAASNVSGASGSSWSPSMVPGNNANPGAKVVKEIQQATVISA